MERTILVTGCASGIGLETAVAAARKGYFVYAGVRDLSASQALREASAGLTVKLVQLDITRAAEREAVVQEILSGRGRLDALVNNAGVALGGFLEQVDESEIRHVFEVNVFGSWAMTRLCLPLLRHRAGAKVIFLSSIAGRSALPGLGSYAASKFALEGMGEAWRHELRPFGVDVVLVEPGAYRTAIFGSNRRVTRNAYQADSPYAGLTGAVDTIFQRAVNRIARDPREVAERIVRILSKRRPALRYPIGLDARARLLIIRTLPFWLVEWFIARILSRAARISP